MLEIGSQPFRLGQMMLHGERTEGIKAIRFDPQPRIG